MKELPLESAGGFEEDELCLSRTMNASFSSIEEGVLLRDDRVSLLTSFSGRVRPQRGRLLPKVSLVWKASRVSANINQCIERNREPKSSLSKV